MDILYYLVYFFIIVFIIFMQWFVRGGNQYLLLKYDLLKGEFK